MRLQTLSLLRNLAIAVIVSAAAPLAAHAQGNDAAEQFVTQLAGSVGALHAQSGDTAHLYQGCHDLMAQILDIPEMARAASGAAWDTMTQQQRAAYLPAFEHRVLSECLRPIQDYNGAPLALIGVRTADNGELLVAVRFSTAEDPDKIVTWRLRKESGDMLKAVDIIVNGSSMIAKMRDDFAAVLQGQSGNVDALIEFLRR